MQDEPLACITVAGRALRNRPGILADLAQALRSEDINIDAVASGMDSVTFYVNEDLAEDAEYILHEQVVDDETLSSVTVESNYAVIRVTGGELPNRPGIILDIVQPVSEAGINIHDLITSATSVAIFVGWKDRERTLEIVQEQTI
jgi:aspartate kinase